MSNEWHTLSLITTIASGFGLALIFGFIAERLRLPALAGYLFAGTTESPLHVLSVVAIIILGKSLAAGVLVLAFRYPLNTSLTVAAMSLVFAGALISIALNPLVFATIEPVRNWILKRSARRLKRRKDPYAVLPMNTARKHLEGQWCWWVTAGWDGALQHP